MLRYARDYDLETAVRCMVRSLGLSHVDTSRVFVIRSWGSRSKAVARIYGMPSAWRFALGLRPMYLIEVLSERFDHLTAEEKAAVLVHELLHVPYTFSGGLRPHGKLVNGRAVRSLIRRLDKECLALLG